MQEQVSQFWTRDWKAGDICEGYWTYDKNWHKVWIII